MKKITIVVYRTFEMEHTEVFINKTDAEIRAKLDATPISYMVLHTYYAEVMSEYSGAFKSDAATSGTLAGANTAVSQRPGYLGGFDKKED